MQSKPEVLTDIYSTRMTLTLYYYGGVRELSAQLLLADRYNEGIAI